MDKRHLRRQQLVQELFAISFNPSAKHCSDRAKIIMQNHTIVDKFIQSAATKYNVDKIAKVDLAILRVALYELTIEKKIPPKVIINEAVELAKELGAQRSGAFVNAVLGKIYEQLTNTS